MSWAERFVGDGCLERGHVPCALTDAHGRVLRVECQECGLLMSREDWERYFAGSGREHGVNWEEGDPRDLGPVMCTTGVVDFEEG